MLKAILFYGLTFMYACNYSTAVEITSLKVPATYTLTNEKMPEPLTLDCKFDISSNDTGLVLKWLLNDKPIYQWILNQKPTALGSMKTHIDTTYSISQDKHDRYRAISIRSPEFNMTGTYMCAVQSFQSISRKSAKLIIISPETDFNLDAAVDEEGDDLAVSCNVEDIHPAPHLTISINDALLSTELQAKNDKKGFDVTATAKKPWSEITSPATVKCVLTIPETDYEKTKQIIYNYDIEKVSDENIVEEEVQNQISRLEANKEIGKENSGILYQPWSFMSALCICITALLIS